MGRGQPLLPVTIMKIVHTNVGTGIETLTEWMGDIHELTEGGDIIISNPPSGFHKIYNIYAKKIGDKYHLMVDVNTEPE